MHSATSAVRWHLNPWLRNAVSIILAAKWVISPFLLCDMYQVSRGMDKRFTLYAFSHSYSLERAHDHASDCYFCLTSITGVTAHRLIPKFAICDETSTWQCRVTVPKPPKSMTLSDSKSSDEDVGQANDNMDWIQLLQEPFFPMYHTCWHKGTWMISSAIWTCQRSKLNF